MDLQFKFCEWCGKTGVNLKLFKLTVETPRGNDDTFALCAECANDEHDAMTDARDQRKAEWSERVFGEN
jgi:hypothetical protein